VSGNIHFTSHVQVENVKLSRKVIYYFAIDSIVNSTRAKRCETGRTFVSDGEPNRYALIQRFSKINISSSQLQNSRGLFYLV